MFICSNVGTSELSNSSVQQLSHVQLFLTPWLQHARSPCPSPTPCPLSRWCHPTISSSLFPFSSRLQSFPASGSFPMSLSYKGTLKRPFCWQWSNVRKGTNHVVGKGLCFQYVISFHSHSSMVLFDDLCSFLSLPSFSPSFYSIYHFFLMSRQNLEDLAWVSNA